MKHNQIGSASHFFAPFLCAVVLLVVATSFGAWAFSSRQQYKDNAQQLVQTAVATEKTTLTNQLNASFTNQENNPLNTYHGPEAYGSLSVSYPKTWSAYVDDTGTASALVIGYFTPGILPPFSASTSVYALQIQVINAPYSTTIQSFTAGATAGTDTVIPYTLPRVPSVVGIEVTGQLGGTTTGTMVVMPERTETIELWTDTSQYLSDFNAFILPNFSFAP